MKIKQKTYKPKKCRVCPNMFTPVRTFQTVCSLECSIKVGQQKLEAKAKKDWRKEKKVITETLKKRSDWEKELQTLINKLVRLIDRGHPCISSGTKEAKFDAGHYYSRGSNPTIRFHLMNIYAQTAQDNNNKSGNPIGYREGLISTFGIEHMEYIEGLKAHPPIKLTVYDLKDKIRIARECVKEMEQTLWANGDKISTRSRLMYRTLYNNKLNIYQY